MSCAATEPYALQVLDDSMAPEFPAGCVVIVEPARWAEDGDFVVADAGSGLALRRYRRCGDEMWLEALAPGFPPSALAPGGVRGIVRQRARARGLPARHFG